MDDTTLLLSIIGDLEFSRRKLLLQLQQLQARLTEYEDKEAEGVGNNVPQAREAE
jgi:hypothetical protein